MTTEDRYTIGRRGLSPARRSVVVLALVLALPWASEGRAQEAGGAQVLTLPSADTGLRMLQDRPFDRDSYEVGPGDVLALTTVGAAPPPSAEGGDQLLPSFVEVLVTPEGLIVLPTIGIVPVMGLSLDEAEARVQEAVGRYYRNVEVRLTLQQLRSFKVFVVGAVPEPGPREASAATRVSELLSDEVAGDPRTTGRFENVPEPTEISQRNVLLVRADGDTVGVDLVRFRQTGDLEYNPTLRSGDLILVPGLDESITVEGRVFFPGTYEYREGESLAELLDVANGYRGFPSDAHDVIRVSRFVDEDSREFLDFTRDEATGEKGRAFEMEPFDAVYVPVIAHYKEQKVVSIRGEVDHPGAYPIRPDTTTVRELVEMAGGFTSRASLVQARLLRVPQEQIGLAAGDTVVPVELLTDRERRILEVRRRGGEGNVVIDFVELFREGADVYDVALRADDELVIPERRRDVTVMGAVREPGIVEYEEGRTIDDYVDLAGGYTDRGDEGDVVVMKAKLQVQLERDEVDEIESGDTIIVPYVEDRDWIAIYQTTTGFVTSVTSLILFFIAATQ